MGRLEGALLELAIAADDERRRLRDLDPDAGQVRERLGDHQGVALAQPLKPLAVGVEPSDRVRVGRMEEGAGRGVGRVADGPQPFAVADADARLHGVRYAVRRRALLDESERALERAERVVLEPEREG